MLTIEIEIALMEHFDIKKKIIVPNVTSMSGVVAFETDILMLSNNGYATGIEIKISKSDLKNDLKKKQWKNHEKVWYGKTNKERYFKPFKYFYYAVPEYLVKEVLNQVPKWCGVLEVSHRKDKRYKSSYVVRELRKPDHLYSKKWTDKERYQLARLGALRILKYKKKLL